MFSYIKLLYQFVSYTITLTNKLLLHDPLICIITRIFYPSFISILSLTCTR